MIIDNKYTRRNWPFIKITNHKLLQEKRMRERTYENLKGKKEKYIQIT